MTISRVHEVWCDSPNHSNAGTEIIHARGVQLVKVELRKRGWVCSNDNTNAICPECAAKPKQPTLETVPAPEASFMKAFERSHRRVPDETLDHSKPETAVEPTSCSRCAEYKQDGRPRCSHCGREWLS